jgi:hypothetical protein
MNLEFSFSPICVYLRHLRAKVFFYSLIRFVLQVNIFAELRDFFLQWYGFHGWKVDLGRHVAGKKDRQDEQDLQDKLPARGHCCPVFPQSCSSCQNCISSVKSVPL